MEEQVECPECTGCCKGFLTFLSSAVLSPRITLWAFVFQQVIHEERVPIEVAACETAGFGGEAVGPCEACALHPSGGIGFGAGVDIEGEANGKENSAGEEGLEAVDEFLLLGCAKADPEEVGATGNDCFKNIGLFGACEVAVLRANDLQVRICFEQALAEFFSAF